MNLKEKLNHYGKEKEPFFFCISYDMKEWEVIKLKDLPENIFFSIDNNNITKHNYILQKQPISKQTYKIQFDQIQKELQFGNTYLTNLTTQTNISCKYSLKDIYQKANAKFKIYFKDKFISFSPERFIKCHNNKIFTYPMKGTIDATIPSAKEKLLRNTKELAEHTMVVDLLRNDLSIISTNVTVEDFRYPHIIQAGNKKLIQTSSKIVGCLKDDWNTKIGDILVSLLPAGSITGTPKKSTINIINKVENYNRGFFTGIFGIFDGNTLDSAIMIRFIEQTQTNTFVYKSGGGITADSLLEDEYQEMIDKVYIP